NRLEGAPASPCRHAASNGMSGVPGRTRLLSRHGPARPKTWGSDPTPGESGLAPAGGSFLMWPGRPHEGGEPLWRAFLGPVSWRNELRRLLVLASVVLACAFTRPVAAESIVDRPPMDLGNNQTGTLTNISQDLLMPRHEQTWWFDAGVSYPV